MPPPAATADSAGAPSSTLLILLLGAIAAVAPLAIDMYLPALPAIASDLKAPDSQIQLSLALFMLGFALCQLAYGPLSDRCGRRPILLFGLTLFSLASLACALAGSIEQLLVARTVQALGGGASAVVINAVVRDLYRGVAAARVFSLVILSMTLAPLLAPNLGGLLLTLCGWRSIFLLLGLLGLALTLLVALRLPETLPADKRQQPGWRAVGAGYAQVLRHRQAMGNLLCSAFAFGGMFAFITASPFVYIDYFGVEPSRYGILFGCNVVLLMLANGINSRVIQRTGLYPMILGASGAQCLIGALLLLLVLGGAASLPLMVLGSALFIGLLGLLAPNTSAAVVSPFDTGAGSASALLGMARFTTGGVAAVTVAALEDGTPLPMVAVMAAFALLGLLSFLSLARPD